MIIYIVNNILDMKRGARRIEPTLHHCLQAAGPYKDMLCVRWWSDAGPAGRVRCWQVQRREP